MFIFPRRQQCYHLFGCETHGNRAITAQSWDYLVYLRSLAVHKDHLPHQMMTSQSAFIMTSSGYYWKHHKMFTWWHRWSLCMSADSCTRMSRDCPFKRTIVMLINDSFEDWILRDTEKDNTLRFAPCSDSFTCKANIVRDENKHFCNLSVCNGYKLDMLC